MKTFRYVVLTLLAVFAFNANALNIKYGDSVVSDDPGCVKQQVEQGPAGNVRVACTQRSASTAPATVPAVCENGGRPLQVLQGTLDWNVGAGIATYSGPMKTGNAYIYSMRTGAASSLATLIIAEYGGAVPWRTLVISRTPCDFDALNPANPRGVGTTAEANFSVGVPNALGYPVLQANTMYFVNVRNATWTEPTEDTCPQGADCKFVMSLRHQ